MAFEVVPFPANTISVPGNYPEYYALGSFSSGAAFPSGGERDFFLPNAVLRIRRDVL